MKKSTPVQFVLRILIYCVALFLIALGVVLALNSDLGTAPVNSLPYVVSRILNVQMGTCVTVIFCFYILLQIIILRKEFQIVQLLQIVFSTIFGYFVDFVKMLLDGFVLPAYAGRLAMLAASIVLIALGVLLYMDVQLVPMPMEGLSSTIAKKINKPFPTMKMVIDCLVVLAAVVLSLVFLGTLDGIREGTVLMAMFVGRMIAVLRKPISPVVKKICFGE